MRFETGSDWLRAHPPSAESLTQTLAGVARRTLAGEDFRFAVREFLDEFALRSTDQLRSAAIAERPESTGEARYDAYLGALAEHIAVAHDLERPLWAVEPNRFLDRFWFLSDVAALRATAIAQSPAAFKRRGVFVPERSLYRV